MKEPLTRRAHINWLRAGLTGIILALLLLVVRALSANPSPISQSATMGTEAVVQATPTATFSIEGFIATAEAIKATLPTRTLVPGWPEDKAKGMADRDLSETAYATMQVLYPPPPDYPEMTPVPTVIFPTAIPHNTPTGDGVIRDKESDGPPCTMVVSTNEWSGQINGQQGEYYTLACAGADKQDKTLGAVVVRVGSHDPDIPSEVKLYRTSVHAGKLRIVGEANHTLTLQATDNSLLYFDLITQQWVQSPLTPVPTLTALP